MARRFRTKLSTTKNAVKHSSTTLANIGSGSIPTVHSVYFTDVGARLSTGATSTIKENADNAGTCNVGDIIKYVNICIQVSSRADIAVNNGWLEWALVRQVESTDLMGLTSLGTQTLQDTAQKQFRNNVLLTGCLPVASVQPNSVDLKIKIPRIYEKLKQGGILILFSYFRSQSSTDVQTDSHRLVVSSIFKAYS